MRRSIILGVVAIVVIVIAASAYYYSTIVSKPVKETIEIGSFQSFTGADAANGIEIVWVLQKAVKDVNEKGGVYVAEYGRRLPVRLTLLDDASSPATAAECTEKLIKYYRVDFIIGGHDTKINTAAMEQAKKYNVLFIQSFTWGFDFKTVKHPLGLDIFVNPGDIMKIWYELLVHVNAPKTLAIILEDNYDGRAVGDALKQLAKEYGFTIPVEDYYQPGIAEFAPIITKLKTSNAEHVFFHGFTVDLAAFVKQTKEMGYNWKYLCTIKGGWPIEFFKAAGRDSDYVVSDGFFHGSFPYPGAKELWDDFRASFGKFSVGSPLYYAAPQVLFQAIEKAGTLNAEKVVETVKKQGPWSTVMGPLTFDEDGFAAIRPIALQWFNGELSLIYPFDIAPKQLVYPAPPWSQRG
ncbi:MAG: amino acid ABC transporter substrate-binding protein [Nitrososphaerota archaeon]|nr:amino acid ABC transporter substrate-binding protein [Nitrososphaerota archaeon]